MGHRNPLVLDTSNFSPSTLKLGMLALGGVSLYTQVGIFQGDDTATSLYFGLAGTASLVTGAVISSKKLTDALALRMSSVSSEILLKFIQASFEDQAKIFSGFKDAFENQKEWSKITPSPATIQYARKLVQLSLRDNTKPKTFANELTRKLVHAFPTLSCEGPLIENLNLKR